MMTGHTHEDIDQMFSRFSYQKDNILSLKGMKLYHGIIRF